MNDRDGEFAPDSVAGKILIAAAARIRRVGIKATRIQDICDDAGVARTSFYREFRNIDDVTSVVTIMESQKFIADTLTSLKDAEYTLDYWREFMRLITSFTISPIDDVSNQQRLDIIDVAYRNGAILLNRLLGSLRPHIEASQRAGTLRGDLEADVIGEWMLRQAYALNAIPFIGPDAAEQRLARIDQFIMPALSAPRTSRDAELHNDIREILQGTKRLEQGMAKLNEARSRSRETWKRHRS